MGKNSQALSDSLMSSSFIGVVFSVTGWALLETWLLLMHASGHAQVIGGIAGTALVLLSARYRSHYRNRPDDKSALMAFRHQNVTKADAACAFLLCLAGLLIGVFILYGSMFLLSTLTLSLCLVPWSRIPFCRNHFYPACTMIWVGIALALYFGRPAIDLMFPGIAAWVLWTCTTFALLLRTEKLWQSQRSAKRMASAAELQSLKD